MGKVVIFSAPSGSGKTTIVRALLERYPQLEFSISATSRAPRGCEQHGKDYYFFSQEEFMQAVSENKFVEWEEFTKAPATEPCAVKSNASGPTDTSSFLMSTSSED